MHATLLALCVHPTCVSLPFHLSSTNTEPDTARQLSSRSPGDRASLAAVRNGGSRRTRCCGKGEMGRHQHACCLAADIRGLRALLCAAAPGECCTISSSNRAGAPRGAVHTRPAAAARLRLPAAVDALTSALQPCGPHHACVPGPGRPCRRACSLATC